MSNEAINIMLIEDNLGDVILVKEAFSSTGKPHKIFHAQNTEEAMEMLTKSGEHTEIPTPDIILLDLNLPGHNGSYLLKKIKQDETLKTIPTLVVSSSKAPNDVLGAYHEYANAYICKPQTLDDLTDMANAILTFWFNLAILPKHVSGAPS